MASIVQDSHQATVIASAMTCWFVAFVVLCLRFYCRMRLIHFLGTDDWLMLVALILCIVYVGLTIGRKQILCSICLAVD